MLAFVLVWSLWGLWIFLDSKGRGQPCNFITMLICGPSAWLTALWYATHRRLFQKKPLLPKEEWEAPKTDRWKN